MDTVVSISPILLPDTEQAPRHFQCSTCKRAFTRADHLSRHVRAHTRHKPYVCPICSKGFSRVDLLKRHTTAHATDDPNKQQRRTTVRPSRVIRACEACAQNHLRCEHEKPCSRCRNKGVECRVPAATDVTFDESRYDEFSNMLDSTAPQQHDAEASSAATQADSPGASDVHMEPETHQQPTTVENMINSPSQQNFDLSQNIAPGDVGDQWLQDHLRSMPPFESSISGTATPRGIMDLSFDWDIDLNDMDMSFLDFYNHEAPFSVETPSTDTYSVRHRPDLASEASADGASLRHEAFKKSVWRYLPRSGRDFYAADQPNLAFEDAEMNSSHRRSRLNTRRAIQERLDRVTRDKLLSLVLGTCSPANVGRIAGAFPTIELLDGLIQYFLTSSPLDAKSWFHLPTFSPSKLRTELLASIIAAGAVSTPDTPLRKLGFALHEASRASLARSFEADNSSIRDFQHLQTLLLQLEIGMWSGISRKMEISESFLQPLVTMLRRGGRFRRSTWKDIVPQPGDDGPVLKEKWERWVLQELYLRVVFRTFELDRQSSMALLKPPLISYSELHLPLPHCDALWHAPSAQSWKSAYLSLSQGPSQRPSFAECLLDLDSLSCHQFANLAYLYMVWGMIWEYRQMEAVGGRFPGLQTSSLIVSSRHQELTKCFENFHVANFDQLSQNGNGLIDLMLMHLNAPLDEIQLFAGIEGQEEARRVYPSLQRWIVTSSARQALWHAGQVLHAARSLPKGFLRNFSAIAVYHAGLLFWGYGLLNRTSTGHTSRQPINGSHVCLDSDDSIETRRFVSLGRGIPALQGSDSSSPILISDMNGILASLVHLLKTNHDTMEGPCPPLVDNLVQLMEGLGCVTE